MKTIFNDLVTRIKEENADISFIEEEGMLKTESVNFALEYDEIANTIQLYRNRDSIVNLPYINFECQVWFYGNSIFFGKEE